jgi:Holliday junction resolvase-like predicted endonuclease
MNEAHALGARGERFAAKMLAARGLRILARNTRIQGVEIDLIAYDPSTDELVVVEVKTASDGRNGLRQLSPRQRRRLARATRVLACHGPVRAEAIAIHADQSPRYRFLAKRISLAFMMAIASLTQRLRREVMYRIRSCRRR